MNLLAHSDVTADVAGYSGGWTRWGVDTTQDLRGEATDLMASLGYTVKSLTVTPGTDLGARVLSNTFPYVARVKFAIPNATTDQALRAELTAQWEALTGVRPVVSFTSLGEPAQTETLPAWDIADLGISNTKLALFGAVLIGAWLVLGRIR